MYLAACLVLFSVVMVCNSETFCPDGLPCDDGICCRKFMLSRPHDCCRQGYVCVRKFFVGTCVPSFSLMAQNAASYSERSDTLMPKLAEKSENDIISTQEKKFEAENFGQVENFIKEEKVSINDVDFYELNDDLEKGIQSKSSKKEDKILLSILAKGLNLQLVSKKNFRKADVPNIENLIQKLQGDFYLWFFPQEKETDSK